MTPEGLSATVDAMVAVESTMVMRLRRCWARKGATDPTNPDAEARKASRFSWCSTIPREIDVVDRRVSVMAGVARRRLSMTARNRGVASMNRFIVDSSSREVCHQSSIMMPRSPPLVPMAADTAASAMFIFSGWTSARTSESLVKMS